MTDEEKEIRARLGALEFVVEVVFANELAVQPEQQSRAFKLAMRNSRARQQNRPLDALLVSEMRQQTEQALDRLANRIDEREGEIRSA